MDVVFAVIVILVMVVVLAAAFGNSSIDKEAKRTGESIAEVRERRRLKRPPPS